MKPVQARQFIKEPFTWAPADHLPAGVGTVEPRLVVTPGGVVALFDGRPGLHIWLNTDGKGVDWQDIDLLKHHNVLATPDHVRPSGYRFDGSSA